MLERKSVLIFLTLSRFVTAQPVGVVVDQKAGVYILVRPKAGTWETKAAQDLSKYLSIMSGQAIPVKEAPLTTGYPLVVGELALQMRPELRTRLTKAAKTDPVLRADAITISSGPQGTYLAGTNDDSHYFAAAQLLRQWGCRWYLPTDFGECIPRPKQLTIPSQETTYAPPFEVRSYWLSWNGDRTGYLEFAHRNFFNLTRVNAGHALGPYIKAVKQKFGKFEVSDPRAAEEVAQQILPAFRGGASLSLSMEDASVAAASPADEELAGSFRDKYFGVQVFSDAYLAFYNRVCRALLKDAPESSGKIGFLAYINLTMPPQRGEVAEKPLICYLAPIDTDPNHSFADPKWASKQDYLGSLRGWTKAMQGRVIIYDYDQSMLVWRDLPNPSHQVIQVDVKEYRHQGILGIDTESRGATATTFLNLYFRGQLYWNPDLNVDQELKEFYPAFFGPAAAPMEKYWSAIYQAWRETKSTEHEYFLIPVIYTKTLVATLRPLTQQALVELAEPYRTRVEFVERSFALLENCVQLNESVAQGDYQKAADFGTKALEVREQLTQSNPTFTTYKKMAEKGPAWWPGEVEYLKELASLVNGPNGRRILQSPIAWQYRDDPDDHGLWQDWAQSREGWSPVRTDVYLQTQKETSGHGFGWYRWSPKLTKIQARATAHLMLPGVFNECWLYVNGKFIAHRPQKPLWWNNDYKFQWDVNLGDSLKEGENLIVLRTAVPFHFAGIFRPPFLYEPLR